MKKILIISNMYPSNDSPHYGVFVKNAEEILREKGFDVKVSSMHKPKNRISKLIKYSTFYLKSTIQLLFNNFDYVYVHFISLSSLSILFVSKLGKKLNIIANIHGNDLVPDNDIDRKRLIWSDKLLEVSSKVVVPSEYFKSELEKRLGKTINNIYVYPSSGVNTKTFYKKNSINKNTNYIKIGFVSRIEKDKGWDLYLKMISRLVVDFPHWEFHLVGEGHEEHQCQELAIKLGIIDKIHFYKFMSHDKLNDFYNEIDLFVFPTYRKSESLGLVGLEAMACGTIVIGPDSLGPSSYLENGKNGLMFKTKDVNSLVDTVKFAVSLPFEKKSMISNEAIKTAEKYSKSNTTHQLVEIFSD